MGCYGYLCKGCGTHIAGNNSVGGELCVLIHVRHGVEVGRTTGHYNEYGSVIEDGKSTKDEFDGTANTGKNGHDEIMKSCFDLPDSVYSQDEPKKGEVKFTAKSGVAAWHKLCYDKAGIKQKDLTPSDGDPNQSWGKIRGKYG